MTLTQAIFLGILQGVAEFLPISSSAHLVIAPWLFHWQDPGLTFDVILHLGTAAAVFIYFAGDWLRLSRAGISSITELKIGFDSDRILFWWIVLATIPGGIVGLLFHHQAETFFRSPLLIATTISLLGLMLYWVDSHRTNLRKIADLSLRDVLWIGISQAFAIIPGVSRSGATMMAARGLGLERQAGARFSFLMSFPIVLAAGLLEGKKIFLGEAVLLPWGQMIGGFLAAFIFGLLAIHFLLYYLSVANYQVFAWYRVGLGLMILIVSLARGGH